MYSRIMATISVILAYIIGNSYYSSLFVANIASQQFKNSDTSYAIYNFISTYNLPLIVTLFIIALLWYKVLKNFFFPVILVGIMLISSNANAYYDQKDYAEPFFILPNESAFYIPDVGENKDSQAQFGSEEYLRSNKIAAKRFLIPHMKLENSSMFVNYYVPAGRLIIIDRTPYNREWIKSGNKGTSAKNEGFEVQSKEGLNITIGIAIAASVNEEDSPRFLFRFGVLPPRGDRTKPEVIFTSVYYGQSLAMVMDTVVRSKVQAILGNEFTVRTFDQCNADSAKIIDSVQKQLITYLQTVGITLDYIGWADTFEFDSSIQDAINRKYIAVQDEAIAKSLGPYTNVIKDLAVAGALRSFGDKTDGKLPTTVSLWWMPAQLSEWFGNLTKNK